MPFIELKANCEISKDLEREIVKELIDSMKVLQKPEKYLMVDVEELHHLWFDGSDAPACIAKISVFGSGRKELYDAMTAHTTKILSSRLQIPENRIYVMYMETPYWGLAGHNF